MRIGIRPKSKGGITDKKATHYTLRFRICFNRIGPEFRSKSNTAVQSVPRWQMDRGKGAIQSVPGWQVGKINSHEQGNIVRPNMLR